jgi:hypothetical protein
MLDLVRPYLTPIYLIPGLVLSYYIGRFLSNAALDAKVHRLGARAPIRTSYVPLGLDMLYQVLSYMLRDKNLELWENMMETWGKGVYTVEAGTGERVILTAEPENIKAILATQFKEYGKGESFRKDWFNFLGNGIFAVDGQVWHNARNLIRPQFVKDRLSDIEIFEEHVQVLIKKLEEGQVDMLDMNFRYVVHIGAHFMSLTVPKIYARCCNTFPLRRERGKSRVSASRIRQRLLQCPAGTELHRQNRVGVSLPNPSNPTNIRLVLSTGLCPAGILASTTLSKS